MNEKSSQFVLDTSAIFTLTDDEEGADIVADLLNRAKKKQCGIYVSFMTFMEVYYKAWQEKDKAFAQKLYRYLKALPIKEVSVNEKLLMAAGELKALHDISLADAWIAGTALETKSVLVNKDPEFEVLQEKIELLNLPYK